MPGVNAHHNVAGLFNLNSANNDKDKFNLGDDGAAGTTIGYGNVHEDAKLRERKVDCPSAFGWADTRTS